MNTRTQEITSVHLELPKQTFELSSSILPAWQPPLAQTSRLAMQVPARRAFVLSGLAAGALALAGCGQKEAFHGIDITGAEYARDFNLTAADGRPRTLADFKGQAVLVFFGFTQCPDVCPTALARAVEIRSLLGSDGPRLQVLFVTIDPERDTPVVLKAYIEAFDPGFLGLYGTAEQTAEVAREFKVIYNKVPTGSSYTMDHSTLSYLFDPAGKLRLALRHASSAQECAQDIRRILTTT